MTVALTALLLATLSGLRTWFPLWLVAFAMWVRLVSPTPAGSLLAQGAVVALLTVLWAAEIGADKVLELDRQVHDVMLVIKPFVATLVALVTWPDVAPAVAGFFGVAGGISAALLGLAKRRLRAFATQRLPGMGNVLVSAGEDVLVVLLGLAAILAPVGALVWVTMAAVAIGVLLRVASRADSPAIASGTVPLVRGHAEDFDGDVAC